MISQYIRTAGFFSFCMEKISCCFSFYWSSSPVKLTLFRLIPLRTLVHFPFPPIPSNSLPGVCEGTGQVPSWSSFFPKYILLLYKRIVEPSKLNCHRQTYNQQNYAQSKRRKISPLKRPSGIPRPFLILPKSTQFHRIRDRINTVQTRQNQR